MKNTLMTLLDNNTNVYNLVQKYTFGMIIYLLSVYWLEFLRLTMCPDVSSFNKLFDYLEDKALQVDKSEIYKCISCIVTKLFGEFCNAIAIKPKTKVFMMITFDLDFKKLTILFISRNVIKIWKRLRSFC